jgi:hypothetical protein
MSYPSITNWPGHADHMPLLFPEVPLKSYDSFSSFCKQCEKIFIKLNYSLGTDLFYLPLILLGIMNI